MDNMTVILKLFCLLTCLQKVQRIEAISMRFTNITCKSVDTNLTSVDYCYIKKLSNMENSMNLRYLIKKNIILNKDIFLHVRFMTKRGNRWAPFLYDFNIDMCKFMSQRYNYLAKLLLSTLDGHTNMNHSCPYAESYITMDNILSTDMNSKINGLPLSKGYYALFTHWSVQNRTCVETNIYFEILNN